MTVQVLDSGSLVARVLRVLDVGAGLNLTPIDESGGGFLLEASGGGSGATDYVWVQTVPAAVWTIPHNLGRRIAAVRVIDSGGEECEGDSLELDSNTLQLSFSAAFGGAAILE